MAEEKKSSKYLLVPGNPANPFNDPWNVGVFCGSVTGLFSAYFFGTKILPFVKKMVSVAFEGPCKMVLIVNSELKMSKGKVGSQCGHATLMAYKQLLSPMRSHNSGVGVLTSWELAGQPKMVLQAPNLASLKKLEEVAKSRKIPVCGVRDAGRTEVPTGSLTVLVLGPAPVQLVDSVTGHLRLL